MIETIRRRLFGPREVELFRTDMPNTIAPIGSEWIGTEGRHFRVTRYSEPYLVAHMSGGGVAHWIVYGRPI